MRNETDSQEDRDSSDGEWTAFNMTDDSQDGEDEQITSPETIAEWQKWYPCPACGSTSFEQSESLTVHGSENGTYQGDDGDHHNEKIVCVECEVVLKSE